MKQTLLEQLEGKHNETPQAVEEDDETSGRDGSDFEGAMGETAAMMLQLISSTKPPLHPVAQGLLSGGNWVTGTARQDKAYLVILKK